MKAILILLAALLLAPLDPAPAAELPDAKNPRLPSSAIATTPKAPSSAPGSLVLESSSAYLAEGFAWAKRTALGRVHPDNGGCYQAALQDRGGYCQRDYVHQIDGAALLGLHRESLAMLRCFATNQTKARGWFTLWEINYDGTPMACDYRDDGYFWRNTAGMFDLLHGAYRLHRWTGDAALVEDRRLQEFYARTAIELVAELDRNGNGIAEGQSADGWGIASTYNEIPGIVLAEAADSLGTQRRAFEAYAHFLRAKGDASAAQIWSEKAARLKRVFNDAWWDAASGRYLIGFDHPGYRPVSAFGYETSWFIPYTGLCEPGPRATAYLDFIHDRFQAKPSGNIEAWTYLPDVFYAWNQNDRGWQYFKRVLDSRSSYPEVSFTILSQIATRIMGIEPNAPGRSVSTLGRLPAEVAWMQLDHVPLGSNDLLVRHADGNHSTTLANQAGPDLMWEARFRGHHATIRVDGHPVSARVEVDNGVEVSSVTLPVKAGELRVATVAGVAGQSPHTASAPETPEVRWWTSSEDLQARLARQPDLRFRPGPAFGQGVIQVDDTTVHQSVLGLGSSLEHSTCYNLSLLPAEQRERVIESLVDPARGIGMNLMRICIGTSDFAPGPFYSYDDMPHGQEDPRLERFSIERDREYVLPVLKAALRLNPKLRFFASSWTPPPWMKTNGRYGGGSLRPECYPYFAEYLARFIEAYRREGIEIHALTVQNEPEFGPEAYPSCLWTARQQRDFIRDHLGPLFRARQFQTLIWIFDHNFNHPAFPTTILKDPQAAQYVDGTAFHLYAGKPEAMSRLQRQFPDKHCYFTEGSVYGAQGAADIIAYLRNGARTYNAWVTLIDHRGKPNVSGFHDCDPTIIVLQRDTLQPEYRADYYLYGQFMKFIAPGALRVATSAGAKIPPNAGFRNPDGNLVLVSANPALKPQALTVAWNGQTFTATLPARTVATFLWKGQRSRPEPGPNHRLP